MNAIKSKETSKVSKMGKHRNFIITMVALTVMSFAMMAFGVEGTDTIKDVLKSMIDIVGVVFQAVGVILSVYSVGQLVLAFKNEDADSKSRASTMLVVGIVLIAIPSIVNGLNLVDKIGSTT